MKKTITSIVIIILVLGLVGAFVYQHHMQKIQSSSTAVSNQFSQNTANTIIPTVKATNMDSVPMEFPSGLPVAAAGSVQVNQYTVDNSHVLHAEYKYVEANSQGATVQQQYLKAMQGTAWKNIQSSDSAISATRGPFSLQVTFAPQGSDKTTVDVTYTLTPQNVNEK